MIGSLGFPAHPPFRGGTTESTVAALQGRVTAAQKGDVAAVDQHDQVRPQHTLFAHKVATWLSDGHSPAAHGVIVAHHPVHLLL
jgi:hypothetical protein